MRISIAVLGLFVGLVVAGCGGGNGDGDTSGNGGAAEFGFSVNCTDVPAFTPPVEPLITPSEDGFASTTLVVLHGKTSAPLAPHLQSFYGAMSEVGYEIIAPYMPWSGTTWNGTMCEGLRYLDIIIDDQRAQGRNVVLVGHSMGAAHAMIHAVTEASLVVDAIIPIAPGHLLHESRGLQNTTADDVRRARQLVVEGNGDTMQTFITLNAGTEQSISASPTTFLSYHDLDQFPSMANVLPAIDVPVLWIAGDQDPLTEGLGMVNNASRIVSEGSEYQMLEGSHLGVVDNAPGALNAWLANRDL